MPNWDWDYQAGPPGSLETLADYSTAVRILTEWSTGRRSGNLVGQYQHGVILSPRQFHKASNFVLEVFPRYTNAAGAVTHVDGPEGHVIENLDNIKRLLGGREGEYARVQRDAPEQGTVYLDVLQLSDALPSQSRAIFAFPLQAPDPFWVGAAITPDTSSPVNNPGSAPVADAVITLNGGTNARFTHTRTGDYIQIDGAPSGDTIIDIGAGTVEDSSNNDRSNLLQTLNPWWMQFDPGDNAVSINSGTFSVAFNAKYR